LIIESAAKIEEMPENIVDRGSQVVVTIGSRAFLNVSLARSLLGPEVKTSGWRWRFV
jgi:hypothetical protein